MWLWWVRIPVEDEEDEEDEKDVEDEEHEDEKDVEDEHDEHDEDEDEDDDIYFVMKSKVVEMLLKKWKWVIAYDVSTVAMFFFFWEKIYFYI